MAFYKLSDYRLCSFVLKIELDYGYLLYNTLTDSLVYLDNSENVEESLSELVEIKDYVPLDFDELSMVDKIREETKRQMPKRIDGYTIFTTLDCNARCFYCYEKGAPHISMSEKTANDVAEFIIRNADGHAQEIRWFGGEPLMNEKVIDNICQRLCLGNIYFQSRMISNGLLFNKEKIAKAKDRWHLKSVQITLDGTKEEYRRAKNYIGAKGDEFERVLSNIEDLLEANIRVLIRLNQDLHNTDDLIDLVEFLAKRFEKNQGLGVYNSLLFDYAEGASRNTPEERYNAFLKLQNLLIRKGLFSRKGHGAKFRYTHCMADNDRSITITPSGKIGKCEHYPNDYLIGSIYSDELDVEIVKKWKETFPVSQKCRACVLYPQCIRIKMCPEVKKDCSLLDCENKIQLIKRAVIKRYKKTLEMRQQNEIEALDAAPTSSSTRPSCP